MNPTSTQTAIAQLKRMPLDDRHSGPQSLDRTLSEIRSGRRLEKIVSSIESFLLSQITRLDTALEECNRAVEDDKCVQRMLADFQLEKQAWEVNRQSEVQRLSTAGEELTRGWEQLEEERRKWSDERGHGSTG